ncbi:unnamed protein product [Lupinus luteus]|uniref:Uncharacterized protein n=1 Tax=Lupinus luteus TaxID=3873 RepID=A0AAV1XID2_LUPLU
MCDAFNSHNSTSFNVETDRGLTNRLVPIPQRFEESSTNSVLPIFSCTFFYYPFN